MERPAFKLHRKTGVVEVKRFTTIDTNEPCIIPTIMHALELSKTNNAPVFICWKPELIIPVDVRLFVFHTSCEFKVADNAYKELHRQIDEGIHDLLFEACKGRPIITKYIH